MKFKFKKQKLLWSSIIWEHDLADATRPAVAFETFFLASTKAILFLLSRSALTLDATTSWAVLAAISFEHTIISSNLPSPLTNLSAFSLLDKSKFYLFR